MYRIILNETSFHGRGARKNLIDVIDSLEAKKILFVTDNELIKCGVADKVSDLLKESNKNFVTFSDIKPNPTIENVKNGLSVCKEFEADLIVAVGGGSVIDTAKAIGIVRNNPDFEDITSLEGVSNTKNKSLPIIALPTTHGTAAEVTINYVITDEERGVKMVCVDPHDLPVVAIVDSELMETLPKDVAAATGMDALTHAIEGYITKAANPMSDMFHMQAIKMIFKSIAKAVNEKDKDAIEDMALAQYIAGMGFSNVGLGIVHSMAHQLGAIYDTPHGTANALLLPIVMRYNGEVSHERFREILKELGYNVDNLDKDQVIDMMVEKIYELSNSVGLNMTIKDCGAKEEDFEMLAQKAIVDPCTGGNPRETSIEDIIELYKKAM